MIRDVLDYAHSQFFPHDVHLLYIYLVTFYAIKKIQMAGAECSRDWIFIKWTLSSKKELASIQGEEVPLWLKWRKNSHLRRWNEWVGENRQIQIDSSEKLPKHKKDPRA